ncbi:S24 family peptidase [Microvirga lotononidis]|uniref:S24 family peptidase n=1 Tax=Microvirga lotononidis TaxID=864069 RepID=UPI0018A83935|nr:S24 family peptidase [Microvirga lotononidis]WQO27864.1 S24 family peptidase [Microvirga lotononidis]
MAGENVTLLAQRAGVSRASIYNILDGKAVSLTILSKILDTTGYSWTWLITGNGMPAAHWEQATTLVPRMKYVELEHGSGTLQPTGRHKLFETELLQELGLSPDNAGVISVSDDAMAPTMNPMDDVLIHLRECDLSQDELFAIAVDDQLTIRRAERAKGEASWILTAQRRDIPAIAVSDNLPVQVYGRVRWIGHKL